MKNQTSNIKTCKCFDPAVGGHHLKLSTNPKHVFLCDKCHDELVQRLADPVMLRGMMKSVMSQEEVQKVRQEQQNDRIRKQLQEKVAAMFASAGYPKHLALPVVAA